MKLFTLYNSTGSVNTYLIGHENGGDAIIIDPGKIDLHILDILETNNYYIKSILLTHDHENHIRGVKTLMKIYDASIYAKSPLIYDFAAVSINENTILTLSDFDIKVIEVPGHSDDSLVFLIRNALFTGDVLSAGRIGLTHGAVQRKLLQTNIINKLFSLDNDLIIFPGHGSPSTLKTEKEFNPFINHLDYSG
ncbi:MAG: MBL fold metallo-hydrolase [Spirochaetia bacterium]|jgi:glyoxylase-like metal-dependent hydrolase (beta-lactamase superfamily II)|nr:MBL fold metallo-hydrolase [Spirochaetia bacterium]